MRRIITAREQTEMLAPWRLAAPTTPLRIERYEPGHAPQLAQEILDQDGPYTLLNLFQGSHPNEHHYVARDNDGTIHGAVSVHHNDIEKSQDIHSLASGLKAPPGVGQQLLQSVAQEAVRRGHRLFALDALEHARRYWESMGGQFDPDEYNDAVWSNEALHGLANGAPVPAQHTLMYDEDEDELIEPSAISSISRSDRLPGSARARHNAGES